jgi:hypothetical protein
MSESDPEKPVPDSVDQQWDTADDTDAPAGGEPGDLPLDVDEADAAEQQREVGLDEDDYR